MSNVNQTIDPPEESPSLLGRAPSRGVGGRRLNDVPKNIAIGLGVLVVALMMYATVARGNQQYKKTDTSLKASQASSPPRELAQDQNVARPEAPIQTNLIEAPSEMQGPQVSQINESPPQQTVQATNTNSNPTPSRYAEQWATYKQKQTSANQSREAALMAALNSPTNVQSGHSTSSNLQDNPINTIGSIAGNQRYSQTTPNDRDASQYGADNVSDFNGQAAKRSFIQQRIYATNYSSATRTPAISPYELKAGSVIPAIMISGLNSDLPGQIIAQVSENVYDTATGQHLLIAQGSRLVGTYDNAVTTGQSRVLVAWNRIIFPDASSMDLNMMPASDQGGYAGFNDRVNNHYRQTFGSALLMSIFAAGIQVSQPQATNGQNITTGQTIAGAVGQQLGQTGSQVIARSLTPHPTLQIRAGYRFNVDVTKDMVIQQL
ncbi:MAG: conjugal transfer protein TrbI [Proteobacteria bacterium]|nr:conjugal transfer protein TrbI [Pseudomonadota bacterium]